MLIYSFFPFDGTSVAKCVDGDVVGLCVGASVGVLGNNVGFNVGSSVGSTVGDWDVFELFMNNGLDVFDISTDNTSVESIRIKKKYR